VNESADIMTNPAHTSIETVALVVGTPGSGFELQPVVFDEVRDDEYLIEMLYTGVCHTVCTALDLNYD
jgi:Zn-dependent alcohol dehydrogenase